MPMFKGEMRQKVKEGDREWSEVEELQLAVICERKKTSQEKKMVCDTTYNNQGKKRGL